MFWSKQDGHYYILEGKNRKLAILIRRYGWKEKTNIRRIRKDGRGEAKMEDWIKDGCQGFWIYER